LIFDFYILHFSKSNLTILLTLDKQPSFYSKNFFHINKKPPFIGDLLRSRDSEKDSGKNPGGCPYPPAETS